MPSFASPASVMSSRTIPALRSSGAFSLATSTIRCNTNTSLCYRSTAVASSLPHQTSNHHYDQHLLRPNFQHRNLGHSVRLIALQDLPHGKAYQGDVVHVKSGYARNFLVPQKLALYATPQNFAKLGLVDPEVETDQQRKERLAREASASVQDDATLKAADALKKYLRNKVLKIWRVVDPNTVDMLHPGMVTAENLRQKLSKQLKIDLEDHEPIHIYSEAPMIFSELPESKIQAMVDDFQSSQIAEDGSCQTKIKRLGDYLAKISLSGGHAVPLRFSVLQRLP